MWSLDTHFDYYNSTEPLRWFVGKAIQISDFVWEVVDCVLEKVSWDNIRIDLGEQKQITLHLVQEWREKYPVESIRDIATWEEIYHHIDPPNNDIEHIPLDITAIIAQEAAERKRYEFLLR